MKILIKLFVILILLEFPISIFSQTITVDLNTSFQTMRGWEAVAQTGRADFSDWNDYIDDLMNQSTADGINRVKINVRISAEQTGGVQVNDNADPFVINSAGFKWDNNDGVDQLADAADLLKDKRAALGKQTSIGIGYVDFDTTATFQHQNTPEEYAELIEATYLHLEARYGWIPDWIEVILEPDHGANSDWNATKLVNNLLATRSRLAARGWNPRFIVPSVTNAWNFPSWWNNMKSVNTTWLQYVDEGAFHRYGSPTTTDLNLNQTTVEADGKTLAMTEFADPNADYLKLHDDLKRNTSIWEQFTIAYDNTDNGNHYYIINHTTHVVSLTSRFRYYRQYFKWVDLNAVRKSASTANSNFDPILFQNVDGSLVLVIKAAASGSFTAAMPAGTYHIRYTTSTETFTNPGDQTISTGQNLSLSMPAVGVMTVFSDAQIVKCRLHTVTRCS